MNPNYSFKEKKKKLLALMNPSAAVHDLALLSEADPHNTQLTSFGLNPARFAEDILFSLLDFKTAEEIRLNRRQSLAPAKENQSGWRATDGSWFEGTTASTGTAIEPEPESKPEGVADSAHESDLKEAQQRAEEAEERAEEAQQRAEEAEERAEEAEERAEEAETALADSKKKDPSKKKKSTRV